MSEENKTGPFIEEIKRLMVGYGDYINPIHRSAEIIEMILRQQMHSLLVQLFNNANLRSGEDIDFKDVLFLMRLDKVKLRRLLKFIKYKDDHDIATLISEEKAKSAAANVTSDDKTKPVDANVTSEKTKPVGTNATSDDKTTPVDATCDAEEKPVLGTTTCNDEEKPLFTNAACKSKENPKLVNLTCNAKEKSINTNSVKEPVATSSTRAWNVNKGPIVKYPKVAMIEIKEEIKKPKIKFKTRLGYCLKFLKYLDHTEELCRLLDNTEYEDETEFERLMTLNRLTIYKDQAQYLDFEEERRSTYVTEIFTAPSFMDWLYRDNVIDFKPTKLAFEMIGYLAHETVATIIQLCLIIKRDRNANCLERIETVPICNTGFPTVQMFNYVPSEDEDSDDDPPLPKPQPKPSTPPPPPKKKKMLFHPKCIQPYDLQEVILRFYNQKSFFLIYGDLDPIEAAKQLFCCRVR